MNGRVSKSKTNWCRPYQVSRTFFSILHGNPDKWDPWEDKHKGEEHETLYVLPDSRTLVDGISLSSLPVFSMTLILSASKATVKQAKQTNQPAQKIRGLFCTRGPTITGDFLSRKVIVYLWRISIPFPFHPKKSVFSHPDGQPWLSHRVDGNRIRKHWG